MNILSKFVIFLMLILFLNTSLKAKMIDSVWAKTYGMYSYGHSVQQTNDGGYIVAGYTYYYDTVVHTDIYLIKTDSLGDSLWARTFGGVDYDRGYSVQQTDDGGYIVAGRKSSDVYLIKTDSMGDSLWAKTFGGSTGYSVQQTTDGGYIVAGYTRSDKDVYLIKTNSLGDSLWARTFGGRDSEYGYSVQQTDDGGYIVAGHTYSYRSIGNYYYDVYLIKTDSLGDSLWARTFGGRDYHFGRSVQQTDDGGYIVAGYTRPHETGIEEIEDDIYLLKTDSLGDSLWARTFGGVDYERGYSVQQTDDGGYIVAGTTYYYYTGEGDIYLLKTDSLGNRLWIKTYGGSNSYESGKSVQQTDDGGYIVAGTTESYYGGWSNIYLIKLKLFPGITVISPNGEEDLPADSTYDITWMSYETSGGVKIEYSLNNGLDWTGIIASTPDDGSYLWPVPDTMSYNCLISISDTNGSLSDTSDEMFTIFSEPYIRVISPNGGEEWYIGDDRYITWRSVGTSGNVRIEYSINNGLDWTTIADTALDEETYSWNIPFDIATDTVWYSDSCLVRIADINDIIADTSDETFSIFIGAGVPTTNLPENYSLDIRGIAINSQLEFNYALPEETNVVTFAVYNIAGQKIKEEILKENPAGFYSGNINMSGISKGIYFIRMEANGGKFTQTKKFLLL